VPEGDTLFRTATALRAALAGKQITSFESAVGRAHVEARRAGILGRRVEGVRSQGKHLLIDVEGLGALRTHLGMQGSWHLYRPGSRWRLARWKARAVIATDTAVAVCFGAPQVEWIARGREGGHPRLARLGPDLLADDPALDEAVRRLRACATAEIGVALLDQGIVAGVGNVYKSEVLFVCKAPPFALVEAIGETLLRRIVVVARRLLLANASGGGPRRTAPSGPPLWVYRRAGRPCRRCGAIILSAPQGRPPRRTYWCPSCQAAAPDLPPSE
jgi:endonuclease-8